MKLADLITDLNAQKREPEELAQDFVEATVKASFDEMAEFRLLLSRAETLKTKNKNKFEAYTTLVILFAAKNPQYLKKVEEFSKHIAARSASKT